jgi:hypothetical protein
MGGQWTQTYIYYFMIKFSANFAHQILARSWRGYISYSPRASSSEHTLIVRTEYIGLYWDNILLTYETVKTGLKRALN